MPWPKIFVQWQTLRSLRTPLRKPLSPGRVTELSLQGCFLETSASLELHRQVLLKIHDSSEFFEAEAVVLYTRPSGLGLIFREVKPRYRDILQNWIIKASTANSKPSKFPASPHFPPRFHPQVAATFRLALTKEGWPL